MLDKTTKLEHIEKAVESLQEVDKTTPFDAIAFTGMSGAAMAFPLAIKLEKDLIMVRKPSSSSHSDYDVEGQNQSKNYIIVDDFPETGATKKRIIAAVEKFCGATYVGVYFYSRSGFKPAPPPEPKPEQEPLPTPVMRPKLQWPVEAAVAPDLASIIVGTQPMQEPLLGIYRIGDWNG